ncbi:MAG: tetratricopeptide repeat protein, partial [Candidatus Acidiferrales bacterium]
NAQSLSVPPEATEGLRLLYSGETEAAIALFRELQRAQPEHPLGYLLEANAEWWKLYCVACDIKWNMIDGWRKPKREECAEFLRLTGKSIELAEQQLERSETAAMRLYAGMGHALEARLHAMREERRATARAGVRARKHLLRAAELDPHLADAFAGIGLYNYYVDTLSWAVKVLRFFMGIPGGDKEDGVRQLEVAMNAGVLTPVEARFYLAKNLRNHEQNYQRAVELLTPLVEQYPRNAVFRLLLGDMHAKLGHTAEAAQHFRTAQQLAAEMSASDGNSGSRNSGGAGSGSHTACAARIRQVAQQALAALPTRDKPVAKAHK